MKIIGFHILKPFILSMCDELILTEKEIFEKANGVGYKIGSLLKKTKSNPNSRKKVIFNFRRCRKPMEFLDLLNLLQIQVETTVYSNPFISEKENFEVAKTGFLIGLSNALFGKENNTS